MKPTRRKCIVLSLGLNLVAVAPGFAQFEYRPITEERESPVEFGASAQNAWGPACGGGFQEPYLGRCVAWTMKDTIFSDPAPEHSIGAVVAIVKADPGIPKSDQDFTTFFTRGYGCANAKTLARVRPVDDKPDDEPTRFRVGSVSKLVTATTVMHLVEQEAARSQRSIDEVLDDDVNKYLKRSMRVPSTTLKNLLVHGGGFEENQIGYLARNATDPPDLAAYLATHVPARLREQAFEYGAVSGSTTGRDASYSSWGMALLGHVVDLAWPKSFHDDVYDHVFEKLGMNNSFFSEPDDHEVWPTMAKGHRHVHDPKKPAPPTPVAEASTQEMMTAPDIGCPPEIGGEFHPQDFEYLHRIGPAASLTTTAADMAKFMRMYLRKGQTDRGRVLEEETVDLMLSGHIAAHDHPGFAEGGLAFYEMPRWKNHPIWSHSGGTLWFTAKLMLMPDENLGIFVAVNTRVSDVLLHNFLFKLLSRQQSLRERPGGTPPPAPMPGTLDDYTGTYLANAHSGTKAEKFLLVTLPHAEITVKPADDNSLEILNVLGPRTIWRHHGPELFQRINFKSGAELIAFARDAHGGVTHLLSPMPFAPAYKIPGYLAPSFHKYLLWFAVACFVVALIWAHPHLHAQASSSRGQRWARYLVLVTAVVNILGFTRVWFFFKDISLEFVYSYPLDVKVALALLTLSLPLTAGVVVFAILAWVERYWSPRCRVLYSLFAVVALAFLWSLNHWNLLGYRI